MGSRVRMPWGKFAGDAVEDIPSAYIVTLLDKAERLDPIMRNVLVAEIIRRYAPKWEPPRDTSRGYDPHGVFNEQTPPHERTRVHVDEPRPTVGGVNANHPSVASFMRGIVDNGYKLLAKKYHPDMEGGSEAIMKLLNEAVDGLRKTLPRQR